jgi:hypothetical protein
MLSLSFPQNQVFFAIRFSNSDLGAFLTAFIFSRSCCRVYEFHMFVFALLFELCFQARQF